MRLSSPILFGLAAFAAGCPRSSFDVRSPPGDHDPDDTGVPPGDDDDDDDDDDHTGVVTDTGPPPPGDPFDVVEPPPPLSAGALSDIADTIDAIRASTVASTGVYVVDHENGQVVYASAADTPKKPASNTKLFTTGLAFDVFGADHRLDVTAWGDAAPSAQGVVDTLTVVSEHDFTWSTFYYADETFPADRLADRLYDAGVRSVGELVVGGDYLVEGYQFGYYDSATHRGLAEDVVFAALEGRGISVGSTSTTSSFAAGAAQIARRGSPPLATSAFWLNVESHNEFADVLVRHDGYELAGTSSYGAGAAEIEDWLAAAGVDTTGFVLYDGSGLSHDNRVTPRQVVGLLGHVMSGPSGQAWVETFSIGGVRGTFGSRFQDADTEGRFFGKSGTLNGVIATSGVLFHRHDGHRYLVSALMNDVVDDTFARSLEDDIVAAVGADRRGLGSRPGTPELREVRSLRDGRLALAWDGAADTFEVWLSFDGGTWDRADARDVGAVGAFVAGELPPDSTVCARIVGTNAAGSGEPSDVGCSRTARTRSRVLVVDGDDRWMAQAENPLRRGHDFVADHAFALGAQAFDSADHRAVRDGDVALVDYDLVIWQLGEESSDDETFDDVEQGLVASAVSAGVHLVVSGAEVGWDLDSLGGAGDQSFYRDVLRARYVEDDARTHSVEGVAGGWFDGITELGFYTPGAQDVAFPDVIDAGAGGEVALRYVGGAGGGAAVVYEGAANVVVFGFPFESIDTAADRAEVMGRILDHTR